MSDGFPSFGHLSADAEETVDELTSMCAAEHTLLKHASTLAMKLLHALPQEQLPELNSTHIFFVGTLFTIIIRRCQAATVLAFRGLSPEADTLTRSALEAMFLLGSLLVDPLTLLKDIESDDAKAKFVMANGMLDENKSSSFLTADQVNSLLVLVGGLTPEKKGRLNVEVHARRAKMSSLYVERFRGISTASSHTSATSIENHMTWSDTIRTIEFGPDDNAGRRAINILTVLVNTSRILIHKFGISELDDEIDVISKEFVQFKGIPISATRSG